MQGSSAKDESRPALTIASVDRSLRTPLRAHCRTNSRSSVELQELLVNKDLDKSTRLPKCGYHFRLSAKERLELLLDPGSFEEFGADMQSSDPLNF
jgi:acetyl-CoA carboxylase beta subunit